MRRIMFLGVVALGLSSCATRSRRYEEIHKAPMGMGQIAIDSVTNDPEEESLLRASPDGKYLLFNLSNSEKRSNNRKIFDILLQAQTGERIERAYIQTSIALLELGHTGKSIVSQEGAKDPAWFADSKSFAFSMLQGSEAMLASTSIGQGSAAVKFLSPTPCVGYDQSPSVSMDGKTIVFSTSKAKEQGAIATMEITQTDAKCKVLFPGEEPQWSPTARKFVFSRVVNSNYQVFTFDEAKNQLTQISFGDFDNYEPSWSPDGHSIVYTSDRNGNADIYTITEDGSHLTQVTQGATEDTSPTWSSDGNIYFVSDANGSVDIWRARIAGR